MFINNTTITSRWSSYSLLWTASGMAAAVLAVTATMGGAVVPMCLNLINMIGFLYPAMKSLRSMNKLYVNGKSSRPISTKNVEEKQPTDAYYHLVYFMMYALFHIVEDSGILLVQITASYCWFKGLLLLWMAHPKIQGSRVVFRVLLSEEAMIVYHSISKLAQYAMENTQQAWDRVWRGPIVSALKESFPFHEYPYNVGFLVAAGIATTNRFMGCPTDPVQDGLVLEKGYEILVCAGHSSVISTFQLGKWERIVLVLLTNLGIFGTVIPKYIQRDGADRHYSCERKTRVLLVHILSGIVSILMSGFMGLCGGGNDTLIKILFFFDAIHQVTILRMVKNHDGTFGLRIGNFLGGLGKFVVMINSARYPRHQSICDLFLVFGSGFLGTRIGSLLSYVISTHVVGSSDAVLESWYSVGTILAQLFTFTRIPNAPDAWLITAPLVSYLYYHELWRRRHRLRFTLLNLAGSYTAMAFLPSNGYKMLYFVLYNLACFQMPLYYRQPSRATGREVDDVAHLVSVTEDKNRRAMLMDFYQRDSSWQVNGSFKIGKAEKTVSDSNPEKTQKALPRDNRICNNSLSFGNSKSWDVVHLLDDDDEAPGLIDDSARVGSVN